MPDALACVVVNCNNKRRTCPGLTFFSFPKDFYRQHYTAAATELTPSIDSTDNRIESFSKR